MRLLVVRHGEANSPAMDPARGLSQRGRAEILRLAAFIRPLQLEVDEVWHSSKARARETALLLVKALAGEPPVVERAGLEPNDPPPPVAMEIEAAGRSVLIVGHLPFVNLLCSLLLARGRPPEMLVFQTGSMACLGRAPHELWELEWLVYPRLLPAGPEEVREKIGG